MSQMTLSDYEYSKRKKKTKREEFLDVMEETIPWDEWVEFVRPSILLCNFLFSDTP